MATYISAVPTKNRSTSVTVAASPVYIEMVSMPFPCTVTAVPGASGTLAVSYSTTPTAVSASAGATWVAWTSGTVSVTTSNTLISPIVALRVVAATSTGTLELSS